MKLPLSRSLVRNLPAWWHIMVWGNLVYIGICSIRWSDKVWPWVYLPLALVMAYLSLANILYKRTHEDQ
jgi:hypothetical protein